MFSSKDDNQEMEQSGLFKSLIGYFYPTTQTETDNPQAETLRLLNENTAFERIITGINTDGFVYSGNYKYYIPKDGTLVIDYLKTLDPQSINFAGTITPEQAKAAGLECPEGQMLKMSLLEYLVHYNATKSFDFSSVATILIQKGASFNINLLKKSQAAGVDLIELWSKSKGLDISKSNIAQITSAHSFDTDLGNTLDKSNAIIYSYFCRQPIGNIFPDCLYNNLLTGHIHLFIEAIKERLVVAEAALVENKSKTSALSQDLTISKVHSAIIQDTTVSKNITNLTEEILKLQYALNAAEIKLASDKMLESEQSLAKLLIQKEDQTLVIKNIETLIEQSTKDIQTDTKKSAAHKTDLEKKKSAFTEKWKETQVQDLKLEQSLDHKKDSEIIATNHKYYKIFLEHLAQKEKTLQDTKASLSKEMDKLTQINDSIISADAKAKELVVKYTKLVKQKPETNPMGQYTITKVDTKHLPVETIDLIKFLHNNTIPMEQKAAIMFNSILGAKWEHITPILSSGFLCDGFKNEKNYTVLTGLAIHYSQKVPQWIILAFVHTSPEAQCTIKGTNISTYCAKAFLETAAFKHLTSTNDNNQEVASISK